jgi:hypothetical protein
MSEHDDYVARKELSQQAAEICWAGIGLIMLASAVAGCIRWVFS